MTRSGTTDAANGELHHYVISGGRAGRERLGVLSSVMAPSTAALLARVGVAAGGRIVDLGCGGGDVTADLARAAGSGTVVGIDADPAVLDLARR